ncbi:MAG: DUF423 domain-containing protein [Methylomonas sp.]|jgi:uncharacterized membrane protein YgdD (TMEM256/DUF423 family)
MRSPYIFLAAITAMTGVAMGAFGAHGLKNVVSEHGLEVYKTAVSYQMWHALALGLLGAWPPQRMYPWVGGLFMLGIVLFSGSLYLLVILNINWLGFITPFGGLSLLAAWGILAYTALQKNRE